MYILRNCINCPYAEMNGDELVCGIWSSDDDDCPHASEMVSDITKMNLTYDELDEVDNYTDLTLAFVRYDGRKYLIELPEDTYEFDSKEALLENIRYNLEELRKETDDGRN